MPVSLGGLNQHGAAGGDKPRPCEVWVERQIIAIIGQKDRVLP